MLRLFTNKCMESRASKLFIKRCIWLNLWVKVALFSFSSAYIKLLSTTGYKVLYGTYIPGRATTEQTYTISGL